MTTFTSERVSDHLTRIITPCGVCMYMAEGAQSAALMDTGFGFGDLRAGWKSMILNGSLTTNWPG